MKKALLLLLAALVVPSVALAAKPAKGPAKAPQVTYELKGTLSNYTAYNASTSTNGSITILVSSSNAGAKSLKGQSLTFAVDAKTAVSLKEGLSGITNGDTGIVKVQAAKNIPPAALAATLQASPASQILDMGVKKVPQVLYILKGTLSNYTAYNGTASPPVNGSITILVKHSNNHGKALKGQTLTFAVDANTKISLQSGMTTVTNGDTGIVKVRAPKKIAPAVLAATLQALSARQIVDQGVKH